MTEKCEEHCWHDTNILLLSSPPHKVEICCQCGETRRVRMGPSPPEGEHGPFLPERHTYMTTKLEEA